MFRKVSALLVRSLRSDARLARFHLLRLALGIVILMILWTVCQNMQWRASPGLEFYTGLTVCNLLAITVAGATFFAMAITEEREEQTLPLLKMADLGPLSLLLGKWLPRMITALLLLSIQIPFTLLAITMGGVAWSHIVATNWMLLAYLILVGNLGLLVSVWNHNTGSAFAVTALLLAMFLLGGPILAEMATARGLRGVAWAIDPIHEFLRALNPFLRIGRVMGGTGGFEIPFQVWMSTLLGILLFGAAWLSFDYATSLEPSGKSLVGRLRDWGMIRGGASRFPRPARHAANASPSMAGTRPRPVFAPGRRRVWTSPIVYKDFHQIAGGHIVFVAKIVGYGLVCGGTWAMFLLLGAPFSNSPSKALEALGLITAFWSLWFLGIEAAVMGARLYRSEIKDRTWATLSLLPRSVPEIAYAKLAGASIGLLPALFFLIGGSVLGVGELWREFERFRLVDYVAVSFFTMQILTAVQLAMLLSVALDFAAWPLAIAMAGFGMIVETGALVTFFEGFLRLRGRDGETVLFTVGLFVAVVLFAAFHVLTLARLDAARASEG